MTEAAAWLVEGLPGRHKGLGSVPSTVDPERRLMPVIPACRRWGQEDNLILYYVRSELEARAAGEMKKISQGCRDGSADKALSVQA